MQTSVAQNGSRTHLTFEFDAGEVQAKVGSILGRVGRDAKIDGFRAGKVPRAVLQKRYGEAARAQAADDLANDGLREAITARKVSPIGELTTESSGFTPAGGFTATLSFEQRPAIAFPDPKSIAGIDLVRVEVTEAQLDESLVGMARRAGDTTPLADGETIIADDALTISGSITCDGKEARKLHDFHHLAGAYPLMGAPPADVLAALKDKGVGATFRLACTLPASFTPAEFAGKAAVLEATVQSAKRLRPAALDDAFAQKLGLNDLAALRGVLRERLSSVKDQEHRQKQLGQLVDVLVAQCPFELPPETLAKMRAENRPADDGKNAEAIAAHDAEAEKQMRRFLLIDALADHLKIDVSPQDVSDQIQMAAHQTGRDPRAIAKHLQSSGKAAQVMTEIRHAKAQEIFLDQVIEAQAPSASAGAAKA